MPETANELPSPWGEGQGEGKRGSKDPPHPKASADYKLRNSSTRAGGVPRQRTVVAIALNFKTKHSDYVYLDY